VRLHGIGNQCTVGDQGIECSGQSRTPRIVDSFVAVETRAANLIAAVGKTFAEAASNFTGCSGDKNFMCATSALFFPRGVVAIQHSETTIGQGC
jgi:hypothetical protein